MKLLSSKKLSGNSYELEIEVDPVRFSEEIDKVYNKQKNKITVPGFRKGKAPRSFVEKYYGENVFVDDAAESILPLAITEAAQAENLEVLNEKIDLEVIKKSRSEGFVFKAKITVMPDVELGEYKGIKVPKINVKVTAKDVEKEINEILKRHSRLVDIEDEEAIAKLGDTAVIDFEGFIDGKNFDGGKADNFPLELGKGLFIPGFEDSLVGHKVGDNFEINLKFPENYHASQYSGKDATFKVKINKLKETKLPEFNDEFVGDISDFEKVADFKADLKNKLLERAKFEAENKVNIAISETLSTLVKADIPNILIKNKISELINIFENNLRAQHFTLKDYYTFNNTNREALEKNFLSEAEKHVKADLALRKIVEIEKISATDEDINKEYEKLANIYKKLDRKNLEELFSVEEIRSQIVLSKALELVKESAIFE